MALWDGLPLNTPTAVSVTKTQTVVATRTSDPLVGGAGTVTFLPNAGIVSDEQVETWAVLNSLRRLRQIQAQAAAFSAMPDYAPANLAAAVVSLNDLLHKSQSIANAVGDIATDLLYVWRNFSQFT